jgi:hypothetical protein
MSLKSHSLSGPSRNKKGLIPVQVHFRNSHGSRIWIAIMRHDPDGCAEYGNWATAGWWSITLGESVHAFNTNNRYFAYYAEAEDGTTWTGEYGPAYVYLDAFESCVGIGSTAARPVGMKLKDGGSAGTFTVNLT